MSLRRVETKKLLEHHNKVANGSLITLKKQKPPPEVFYKKDALLKILQYSQDEQENTCVGDSF